MLRLLLLAAVGFGLTACKTNTYHGTFSGQKLTLQTSQGPVVIPAGQHKGSISVDSMGKATINVRLPNGVVNAKIKLSSAAKPKEDGSIWVDAGKLKQNFDLAGKQVTSQRQTGVHSSSESCVYGHRDGATKCEWVDEPQTCTSFEECGSNAHGAPICKTREVCTGGGLRHQCHTEQIPIYGSRSIEKYDIITTTKLNLQFRQPGTKNVISAFAGQEELVEHKVVGRGSCHL